MIFQKYRLQGAVWTALNEGDGVAILQNFLSFGISDQNNFFFYQVTVTLTLILYSYINSQLNFYIYYYITVWYLRNVSFFLLLLLFFCFLLVTVTFRFIYVMYQLSPSGLYILIHVILIISDKCLKNIFFVILLLLLLGLSILIYQLSP